MDQGHDRAMTSIQTASVVLLALATVAHAVESGSPKANDDMIDRLMSFPPLSRVEVSTAPPSPGSSPELHLAYWIRRAYQHEEGLKIPHAALPKVLEAVRRDPASLRELFRILPETDAVFDVVAKILDAEKRTKKLDQNDADETRQWLRQRSRYLREELLRAASDATDEENWIRNEEDVRAIARLDPAAAKPIIEKHLASVQPRLAALAATLLYAQAAADRDEQAVGILRDRLRTIAQSTATPAMARNLAAGALLASPWDGRNDWFLARLGDKDFQNLQDGSFGFDVFGDAAKKEPTTWLPVLIRNVGSENRVVHEAAVAALGRFTLTDARADALRPLLPWLFDPGWASACLGRLRLIQSLDRVDLPESVPGLLHVLEHDDGVYEIQGAAESITHYGARDAVPALRRALARTGRESVRDRIHAALNSLDAISLDQKVVAAEVFARLHVTEEGKRILEQAQMLTSEKPLPVKASLGTWVLRTGHGDRRLVAKLLDRTLALKSRHDPAARILQETVLGWDVPEVHKFLVARLEDGDVDDVVLRALLDQRKILRAAHRKRIAQSIARGGVVAGIAAAVLEDADLAGAVLEGQDQVAQRALVVAGRYLHLALPVDGVARLISSSDAKLSAYARECLRDIDSPEARRALESAASPDLVITGERPSRRDICQDLGPLEKWEAALKEEMKHPDGPEELVAVIGQSHRVIIRRSGKSVTLSNAGGLDLPYSRDVPIAEFEELRHFIEGERIDELPSLANMDCHGMAAEYIHLSKRAGRRMFVVGRARNESAQARLLSRVYDLSREKGVVRYDALEANPGLRVLLHSDFENYLNEVWARGSDIRVGVQKTPANKWFRVTSEKLGQEVDEPPEFKVNLGSGVFDQTMDCLAWNRVAHWSAAAGVTVLAGSRNGRCGLWMLKPGKEPELLTEGLYADPIISPDGSWVICTKAQSRDGWGEPQSAVRIDLRTKLEYRLTLELADLVSPVAFIASRRGALMYRERRSGNFGSQGPKDRQYHLVNPWSGRVQRISGEFAPWEHSALRGLQPTGKSGEVWAAIYSATLKATRIGRYDTTTLSFSPVRTVKSLWFDSNDMWVDGSDRRVYFVSGNKLFLTELGPDAKQR